MGGGGVISLVQAARMAVQEQPAATTVKIPSPNRGSGEWGSAPNIRVNDKISLRTLPLTFTFRIGAEGTDREEFPVSRAEVHIEFNFLV